MNDTPKLLIYVSAVTPRINYTFRQICTYILGLDIKFTSKIEEFIAHDGVKISYGKQKLGSEFFIQSSGLLNEQGFSDIEVRVGKWGDVVCFFRTSKDSDIPFDIFAASFYMLSRYEEYLPHVKDEHGRFPSKESLAYKKDFITRPVVDIWAHKFKNILKERFDNLEFPEKQYSNRNILAVAEAYKYKKKGIVRSIGASIRDLFTFDISQFLERIEVLLYLKKDPYDIYEDLIKFSKQNNLYWYFLFQLSNYSVNSKNISYNKIKYHALIKSMGDYGKIGLLPGYEALSSFKTLKLEKNRWESIVNRPLEVCLSYFFDINLPNLYNNFEIAYKYLNKFVPNIKIPDAGFFLWLPVKNDIKMTVDLWQHYSLRVMPGSFMAKEIDGYNPGKGFLRLALVDNSAVIVDAMERITDYLKKTNYE